MQSFPGEVGGEETLQFSVTNQVSIHSKPNVFMQVNYMSDKKKCNDNRPDGNRTFGSKLSNCLQNKIC
jgi:hypothetical protein